MRDDMFEEDYDLDNCFERLYDEPKGTYEDMCDGYGIPYSERLFRDWED